MVQDTPSVPTQVNDELIISGTVSVSNNLNTFIINVTMSNNDEEFLPTPSFVFGKTHTLRILGNFYFTKFLRILRFFAFSQK